MRQWEQRPVEVANLLNPAFCGEVLRRSIREYTRQSSTAFPYPLTFLVLPIVLHRKTRESINGHELKQLHVWLQDHQEVRVGFAERARELVPIANESLAFLLQVNAIVVDAGAGLEVLRRRRSEIVEQTEGDVADCYRKAIILGRWFARAGSPASIYTMWGVKP